MHALPRLSVPAHALVELAAGLALIPGSLLLGLGTAGVLAVFAAGTLLAGVGLGARTACRSRRTWRSTTG